MPRADLVTLGKFIAEQGSEHAIEAGYRDELFGVYLDGYCQGYVDALKIAKAVNRELQKRSSRLKSHDL